MGNENGGISIAEAARVLKLHPSTVRRMVQHGAPTLRPGSVGRGRGSLVDLHALIKWRAGDLGHAGDGELLEAVAVTLWDSIRRDEAFRRVGITEKQAAELAVLIYQRAWQNLTGRPVDELKPEDLPEQMKRVCAI